MFKLVSVNIAEGDGAEHMQGFHWLGYVYSTRPQVYLFACTRNLSHTFNNTLDSVCQTRYRIEACILEYDQGVASFRYSPRALFRDSGNSLALEKRKTPWQAI